MLMSEVTPWPGLAERLPLLVESQFAAYRRLVHTETEPEDGPRELAAWENARKAALGHLQALIRIYDLVCGRIAQEAGQGSGWDPALAGVLADIRQELVAVDDGEEDFGA